jgi:arylsulfatase A-like enzyme
LFEGGIRVPAFAHWKGTLAPRKATAPMHAADWMPTLTNLVGWKKPADVSFDGQDMWPALRGDVEKPAPRTIYIPLPKAWAVLRGGWKIIVRDQGRRGLDDSDQVQLFNVETDPSETNDLARREPDRVAELKQLLAELRADDVDELPTDLAGIKD